MDDIMSMVSIRANTNGDTRVADHVPTMKEFDSANRSHQRDVQALAHAFATAIIRQSQRHDWTKTTEPYKSMFYRDFCDTMNGYLGHFEDGEWAKLHYDELERHHLLRHVPEDVNLIDVIEMICDCVCAGMARSNNVYNVEIPKDVLVLAAANTFKILREHVTVEGKDNGSAD